MQTFAMMRSQNKSPESPESIVRNTRYFGINAVKHNQSERLASDVVKPMQQLFNFDFSNVRVTPDDADVARIGASAITQGAHIRFAPDQYRPYHPRGIGLIGHELAHVIQQSRANGRSTTFRRDNTAEQEAELAGNRVQKGQPVTIAQAVSGIQPRMGFEFQGSNKIEYGYELASSSPRWVAARRKSAVFHGRTGVPHVKLESDSRGDFEFVTHPYASRSGLLSEVSEAHALTRHILSWTRFSSEPDHVRLAQNRHGAGSGDQRSLHRGRHWSTMSQINQEKGGIAADAVRIHIEDPHFNANPQFTEGVRLEEIENFFASNLSSEPVAESAITIQSYVNLTISDPVVRRNFNTLSPLDQAQVRGFMSIIAALLLFARRYQVGNPVVKEAFAILHRTRVRDMFVSLSSSGREFIRLHGFSRSSAFLSMLGFSRNDYVFPRGYDNERSVDRRDRRSQLISGRGVRGGIRGPTVGSWFNSIDSPGRDMMSPLLSGTPSMGRLPMDRAPDGSDSLVVLEVRNWGRRIEDIYRQLLTQQYRAALERDVTDPLSNNIVQLSHTDLLDWRRGDPVPNSIPASLWLDWAQSRLNEASRRSLNFTP